MPVLSPFVIAWIALLCIVNDCVYTVIFVCLDSD